MQLARIPKQMKDLKQWVCWRYEQRNGQLTKLPKNPKSGGNASITAQETWSSFEEAVKAFESGPFDGVGFVFTQGDPFAGVDLDKCRDPDTGEIAIWARKIIDRLDSYSEVSPSRTGVKVFLLGRKPPQRCRTKMKDENGTVVGAVEIEVDPRGEGVADHVVVDLVAR